LVLLVEDERRSALLLVSLNLTVSCWCGGSRIGQETEGAEEAKEGAEEAKAEARYAFGRQWPGAGGAEVAALA